MGASMSEQTGDSQREKRRVTVTQLLRSPVLDATGDQVGRVEDFIAKLTDGGYPPITGLKVGVGGHDVFVGRKVIEKLEPGAVRLNTNTIDMTAFQRRPGAGPLSADGRGRRPPGIAAGRLRAGPLHGPRP